MKFSKDGSYLIILDKDENLSFVELFYCEAVKEWNQSFKGQKVKKFSTDNTGRFLFLYGNMKMKIFDMKNLCEIVKVASLKLTHQDDELKFLSVDKESVLFNLSSEIYFDTFKLKTA